LGHLIYSRALCPAVIVTGVYEALEDHLVAPRGRGRLFGAPHAGSAGGAPCGDLIQIRVEVEGDRVARAGFDASGCGAAQAAGSAVVELVEDRPLLDVARLTAQDVSNELGGLSAGKVHAAALAADALHQALGAAARAGAPRLPADPNRTLVAMSGGVDSAVAALAAQRAGHDVVAVTLELWADPAGDGARSCCSPESVATARALAHSLGLPHVTLDLRDAFEADVVDDFVAEHAAGRTPNPCVRCNGLVRFDAMLDLAESLGAARLATGHYARIVRDAEGPLVAAAADANKDQAYMLARLDPAILDRLWFPLAELDKPRVRELAAEARLAVAEKPESQDLCFLAGIAANDLLARNGVTEQPGEIVDEQGHRLGTHSGHHNFTIGQRKGIGIAATRPLYVIKKDAATNTVTVGPKESLKTTEVHLENLTLHRPAEEVTHVKLRYRSAPVTCDLSPVTLTLHDPFEAATPGQTAVLLRNSAVVGWATIADPFTTVPVTLPLAPSAHV
jgi:tRNA-specific 2-thiouridylase